MTNKLFALIDCNNFFVSCERVFNPRLRGVPVMVLSNNDGCVVARSQEVKDLGIAMGIPVFKCEALIKRHNIRVFSSNFNLYGDMSARVMSVLHEHVPEIEVYSIDEAFLRFDSMACDPLELGRLLRKRVLQCTGIPISIGIAPTKTLAKVANHIAKKQIQHKGVFDITRAPNIDEILEQFKVEDIWGVGRQYTKKLKRYRITSARQLKYAQDAWIKKNMTIVGLRTVHELRGIPCLSIVTQPQDKQSIAHTRSFGKKVTELQELKEAIANYAVQLARKLREEKMLACSLYVFIMTSYHTEYKYYNSRAIELLKPTSYTPDIITAASSALEEIFYAGYSYKRAGIIATELLPEDQEQIHAFLSQEQQDKQRVIMQEIDLLNHKWGSGTVGFAAQGSTKEWCSKRAHKSPSFTTKWDELLIIKL
ncbi:MAG: Y-family DNA polymerase [Candidatus Babeliales bacterium]